MSIKKFVQDQFLEFVKRGGERATEEHAADRIRVCLTCPFYGMVEPDPFLPEMAGCTKCGCPSATKPHMITHWRKIGQEHEPLSRNELIEISINKKLNPEKYKEVKTKCPDKVNRWEIVDKKHLKDVA